MELSGVNQLLIPGPTKTHNQWASTSSLSVSVPTPQPAFTGTHFHNLHFDATSSKMRFRTELKNIRTFASKFLLIKYLLSTIYLQLLLTVNSQSL